jgi:hypothetical protein
MQSYIIFNEIINSFEGLIVLPNALPYPNERVDFRRENNTSSKSSWEPAE